ncbi:MAG: hypothetical protein E7K47_09845 [Acidovorax sp.]|nr:hypothetical protein [Acidovorax sp.]
MRYFLKAGGAVAVVGLMMAGCSSIGPGSSPAPAPIGASTAPVGGECNAQGAQAAVGKNATAKVVEDARVRSGVRIPLMADSDSIPIADSVPGDGGHVARVS